MRLGERDGGLERLQLTLCEERAGGTGRERDGGLERLQLRLCEERVGETGRERWGTGKTATETV